MFKFKAWDEGIDWKPCEECGLDQESVEYARSEYLDCGIGEDGIAIYSAYDNGGKRGIAPEEALEAMHRLTGR